MQQIGRYQIIGELGRGAMGVVYRALDPAIGRPVAIKTIRLHELSAPSEVERLRERLFREAQSAGVLSHPGIVTIYDVGEQDDIAYIAMEFVDGPTLEQILASGKPPVPEKVLSVLRQTAAALDYAHKKGIVHRDIKPANIMLHEGIVAKITDFGVAKITTSQQLTQTGLMLGTPNYMSPEQIQGRDVDGRADQFSLAVMAYEILTGEKPFPGEQLSTVLFKIVTEEPVQPQRLNPTLGWPVSVVLQKALAKDVEQRYPACTEFIAALESACNSSKGWKPLARGASQSQPTVLDAPGPGTGSRTRQEARPRLPAPPAEPSRQPARMITVGFAAIVLAALLAYGAHRWLPKEWLPGSAPAAGTAAPAAPTETASSQAAPAPPPAPARPSPMPAETPAEARAPESQSEPPAREPESTAVRRESEPPAPPVQSEPAPEKPKPAPALPAEQPMRIVTSPPGATIVLDGTPGLMCKTPCTLQLPRGRHTLAATLDGHRSELRILWVTDQPGEVFVNLQKQTGTLQVESDPAGAQIYLNNQLRSEVTPAKLVLPVGKYCVTVVKDNKKLEDDVVVKDGALLKLSYSLAHLQ